MNHYSERALQDGKMKGLEGEGGIYEGMVALIDGDCNYFSVTNQIVITIWKVWSDRYRLEILLDAQYYKAAVPWGKVVRLLGIPPQQRSNIKWLGIGNQFKYWYKESLIW